MGDDSREPAAMRGQPVAPSGEQWELRAGDQVVTVVEGGGGIRSYTVGGRDVLDGYHIDAICDGARGQTLVPWPNRIEDGSYRFDGADLELPLTEPEKHNAIHGLLRWRSWSVVEHDDARLVVRCRLLPSPGYPFALDVRNDYRLDDDGLTVRTDATNIGAQPCPYALGFHPYLTVGLDRVDDAVLHLPGATYLPTDERGIPTGRQPVEGTPYDFRAARPIGDHEIDVAYTDLDRGPDGRFEVTLAAPGGERSVSLWLDETFPYVEIFTGDTLPDPTRRRDGLGVEPMTAPPNGFRTGDDVITLEPGQQVTTSWGIRHSGW